MGTNKVIILDYQLGNLFSVKQACDKVGINAEISFDKNKISEADAIILPGVGAFIEAMNNLEKLDLIAPLKDFLEKNNPLFGICLGQQLLFTESEEFGSRKGLDIIPGVIKKFPNEIAGVKNIKVPQIGWNKIYSKNNSWINSPLKEINDGAYMYFVHSYYVKPDEDVNIMSTTNYEGLEYCSGAIKEPNIFATQFHPEKSGELGLSIYKNWALQHNLL
jgi:glutamine amidotransferase